MGHMIQAFSLDTDRPKQIETKPGNVLFLLRHEREEFSFNPFHLVL